MAATKPTAKPTESLKQITYLASALKAPRITEAAARLADQARDAGWTHEDYLAAVLEREVSARNASGAQLRIGAAGFAAIKTLEDFGFDVQSAIRQQAAALASGGFLTEARNVVLLGPPRPSASTTRCADRSRTCSELARRVGMSREGLYKALSVEGNPSFATIMKVATALGLRIHFDSAA